MNVDEFLKDSAHVPLRTRISAFDAEIRLLRARGVSGQGIAEFLKLNNVEASARAVNKYLQRHPDKFSPSRRKASVAEAQSRSDEGASRPGTAAARRSHEMEELRTSAQGSIGLSPAQATTIPAQSAQTSTHSVNEGKPFIADLNAGSVSVDASSVASQRDSAPPSSASTTEYQPGVGPARVRSTDAPSSHSATNLSNATPIPDAFKSQPDGADTYDGHDADRPSPLRRYDPNDPKNIAAVASYRQRLRDGQIRTGETTNTNLDRSTDET